MVKTLIAIQEAWIPPLGQEKGTAANSSVLAWKIPWTGAWRATVHGVAKNQTRLSS